MIGVIVSHSECHCHSESQAYFDGACSPYNWPYAPQHHVFFSSSVQLTNCFHVAAPAKKVEPKVEAKPQKKRVKKDKAAPKKPMPPFFCYQKARRDTLKTENPKAENPALIKVSTPR